MKKCLTCNNMVPDGRVLSKCDGCLALYYYGRALDQIVETIDEEYPNFTRVSFARIRKMATSAIQAVPRRKEEQDEAQG